MSSEIKTKLNLHLSQPSNSKRINVKQYNKEIAEAEKEIAKGKFTTQEDLKKEMKGW